MAFRIDPKRTATQTTSPTETPEHLEEYGRDKTEVSPISCTEQTPLEGAETTTALYARTQSLVSSRTTERTNLSIIDRTDLLSDILLIVTDRLSRM